MAMTDDHTIAELINAASEKFADTCVLLLDEDLDAEGPLAECIQTLTAVLAIVREKKRKEQAEETTETAGIMLVRR